MRVGYGAVTVQPRRMLPNETFASFGTPVTVQLNSSVKLVPVQVVVLYSDNIPKKTRRAEQLALFDQIQEAETSVYTDGVTHERLGTQRSFVGLPGNPALPWMNINDRGLYQVSGQFTPDSAWASCNVQFRLVNYFELHTTDKHVLPRKLPSGFADPEDPVYYSSSALDSTPCNDNLSLASEDSRFLTGVTTIIFMERSGFPDSPEEGRAITSAACVRRSSLPNLVSHELGHVMGLPDCGDCSASTCSMMCSLGGGAPPPTPSECAGVQSWALTASSTFR